MTDESNARAQALAQLESIKELVHRVESANRLELGVCEFDEAVNALQQDPLSVEVRGGWVSPGDYPGPAGEFLILLCIGGPAVRLVGELDEHQQPMSVRLEYQDWGIPWTEFPMNREDHDTVLQYCSHFWFGEGL